MRGCGGGAGQPPSAPPGSPAEGSPGNAVAGRPRQRVLGLTVRGEGRRKAPPLEVSEQRSLLRVLFALLALECLLSLGSARDLLPALSQVFAQVLAEPVPNGVPAPKGLLEPGPRGRWRHLLRRGGGSTAGVPGQVS